MKTCWTICCLLCTLYLSAQTIEMTVPADSLEQNPQESQEWTIQTLLDPLYQFVVVLPEFSFLELQYQSGFWDYHTWMDTNFYQVSMELYDKYYAKDILIWTFRESIYISINLKDMQSNQGFLQFRIPLSNLSALHAGRKADIDFVREGYKWHYLN